MLIFPKHLVFLKDLWQKYFFKENLNKQEEERLVNIIKLNYFKQIKDEILSKDIILEGQNFLGQTKNLYSEHYITIQVYYL